MEAVATPVYDSILILGIMALTMHHNRSMYWVAILSDTPIRQQKTRYMETCDDTLHFLFSPSF